MSEAKKSSKAAGKKPAAKRSSKSEAVEAIEEVEAVDEIKTAEVRGTTFILPPKLPFKLMLANRRLNQARRNQSVSAGLDALIELAEAFVGEDAYAAFVQNFDTEDGTEATMELLAACDAAYGVEEGESQASSDS